MRTPPGRNGRSLGVHYFVRAFLINNRSFEIVLFANYLSPFHPNRLVELMPYVLKHSGMSLWLRKTM
jgi:hypothetical protein